MAGTTSRSSSEGLTFSVCVMLDVYLCVSEQIDAHCRPKMTNMEQIELDRHRKQLTADVRHLVEKYRSIFTWDVPEIDEASSDKLILDAIRQALDAVEGSLSELRQR